MVMMRVIPQGLERSGEHFEGIFGMALITARRLGRLSLCHREGLATRTSV